MGEMVAATMPGIQRTEMFARLEMNDSEAYAGLAALVVHTLSRYVRASPALSPVSASSELVSRSRR